MRGSSKRAGMLFLINLHVVLDRDASLFLLLFLFLWSLLEQGLYKSTSHG